jgi:hypothetical protein
MSHEIDFCRQRFHIIKEQLEDPVAALEREDRLRLEREGRLLGHVLYELEEGQVLSALESWRGRFGRELSKHKSATRPQQQVYDAWLRLPRPERERAPEPPRPSLGIVIEDKNGQKWVVDDRYLAMMDDLIGRLRKWLGSAS